MKTIESLRFFAADPVFSLTSKGTLIVTGTAADDSIVVETIHSDPSQGLRVTLESAGGPSFGIIHQVHLRFTEVKRFDVNAGDGNDTINLDGRDFTKAATLNGDGGDDKITWNSLGPVQADGGDGNDSIGNALTIESGAKKNRDVLNPYFEELTGLPSDTLLGGDGDDTIFGWTNDQIDGGNGNDTGIVVVDPQHVLAANRPEEIAHDFFGRLGATNLEVTASM